MIQHGVPQQVLWCVYTNRDRDLDLDRFKMRNTLRIKRTADANFIINTFLLLYSLETLLLIIDFGHHYHITASDQKIVISGQVFCNYLPVIQKVTHFEGQSV